MRKFFGSLSDRIEYNNIFKLSLTIFIMASLTKNGKPIELPVGFDSQDNYIELKIEEMRDLHNSQPHLPLDEWVNLINRHTTYITNRIDLPQILLDEYDISIKDRDFEKSPAIKDAKNYLTNLISFLESSYTPEYVPQRITKKF